MAETVWLNSRKLRHLETEIDDLAAKYKALSARISRLQYSLKHKEGEEEEPEEEEREVKVPQDLDPDTALLRLHYALKEKGVIS